MFAHLFKAAFVIFMIVLLTWAGIQLDIEGNTILWLTLVSVVVIGFITLERQSREIRIIRNLLENHENTQGHKRRGINKPGSEMNFS